MANCITPKLLDAINSLDIKQLESRETRSLEELLDPHDRRLVEVLKFRQRIKDLGRNKIYHHVIHKFPDLGPKDVDLKIIENRLRTQGLEKILREFQANVS